MFLPEAYEDCDTQERKLKTFKLSHPVAVTLTASDVRVMHSYRKSLQKIGNHGISQAYIIFLFYATIRPT